MPNTLKARTTVFFAAIFGLFVFITIAFFIRCKSIILDLPQARRLYWYGFIGIIISSAVFVVCLGSLFLKKAKFIRKTPVVLPLLIVLNLVPRVVWVYSVKVIPKSDFEFYGMLAKTLAKGAVTVTDYLSLFPHLLGYSALLSLFYRIFGPGVMVAQWLNIALCCGIAVLIFFLGTRVLDRKCGFIAAVIWSLWPSQIFYTSLVSTEEAYVFFTLLCLLLFMHILTMKRNYSLSLALFALLGVLCTLTNAIRPFGLLLLGTMGIYYFIFYSEKVQFKKGSRLLVKPAFYLVLAVSYFISFQVLSLVISGVLDRNIATSPVGFNAYVGSDIKYSGVWNEEDSKALAALQREPGNTAQDIHNELLKMAIERFKAQGLQNLHLLIKKHEVMWMVDHDSLFYIGNALDPQNPSRLDFTKYRSFLVLFTNYYYHIILLLCLLCALLIIKHRNRSANHVLLLFIFVLGIMGIHMIVEVSSRYHYPAIAIFALIAGYGLSLLWGRKQEPVL